MRSLVAIPVFNEIRHVDRVLDEVLAIHRQVLVIDDGSTDGTGELLDRRRDVHVIRRPANLGYGQSIIDAFAFARASGFEWVITMDCDRQHQPAQIAQFLDAAMCCGCDLVSGSRYLTDLPGSDRPPADRLAINRRLTGLLNCLLGLNMTDAFCGYKAHKVSSLKWLSLTVRDYAFPMQLWVQAARAGIAMCEMPVPVIYNDPNRHFGGLLDDPTRRLQHYTDVLLGELVAPKQQPWQMMGLECDWPAPLTTMPALR